MIISSFLLIAANGMISFFFYEQLELLTLNVMMDIPKLLFEAVAPACSEK